MDPQRSYIHYFIKDGSYSAQFQAENDVEAKIITRRIHGHQTDGVVLYRICGRDKAGNKKIRGVQL